MDKLKQTLQTVKTAWEKLQAAKSYAMPAAYVALGFLAAKLLSC